METYRQRCCQQVLHQSQSQWLGLKRRLSACSKADPLGALHSCLSSFIHTSSHWLPFLLFSRPVRPYFCHASPTTEASIPPIPDWQHRRTLHRPRRRNRRCRRSKLCGPAAGDDRCTWEPWGKPNVRTGLPDLVRRKCFPC